MATLILDLPEKFYGILRDAVGYRIASMQQLLKDPNTPEIELEKIAYANDQVILEMILKSLNAPTHHIKGDCYQIYRNPAEEEWSETTLQKLSAPAPIGHELALTFIAQNFDEAGAISHQFLGFEPYIPMPTHIAIRQTYDFKDLNPVNHGMIHTLEVTIYQPQHYQRKMATQNALNSKTTTQHNLEQQARDYWRCDYQLTGYGLQIYQIVYDNDGLAVMTQAISAVQQYIETFKAQNPTLALIPNNTL